MSASAAEHVVPAPGVPCWVNLMVGDLPGATAFYTAVLGWGFRPSLLGDQFLVASQDGSPVAGIGARRPGLAPASVWTPYFAVRDADVTAARIKERGATLAVGPIALGDGRAGLAADRDGATFGFWQGPTLAWVYGQAGAAPSRLDLRTRDAAEATAFYAQVFGWAAEPEIAVAHHPDRILVERAGRAVVSLRGGAAHTSPEPLLRPRWLVNFAVDDVERAVAAALASGGSSPGPQEGASRTLRDPDGGLFTLSPRAPRTS